MEERFSRTCALVGEQKMNILRNASVLIVGLGGVGGYALEAIARAGIGTLTVVDGDTVCESNLNRQILALNSTIGCNKAEVAAQHVREINSLCNVTAIANYYTKDTKEQLNLADYDYIIDAIDSVEDKALLIASAWQANVPIISCMGTANRLEIDFEFKDIFSTSDCPLARKLRSLLRKAGIPQCLVLISSAPQVTSVAKPLPTISYVPAAAGLLLAQRVITSLLDTAHKEE